MYNQTAVLCQPPVMQDLEAGTLKGLDRPVAVLLAHRPWVAVQVSMGKATVQLEEACRPRRGTGQPPSLGCLVDPPDAARITDKPLGGGLREGLHTDLKIYIRSVCRRAEGRDRLRHIQLKRRIAAAR